MARQGLLRPVVGTVDRADLATPWLHEPQTQKGQPLRIGFFALNLLVVMGGFHAG
jgi:hypothetical protein